MVQFEVFDPGTGKLEGKGARTVLANTFEQCIEKFTTGMADAQWKAREGETDEHIVADPTFKITSAEQHMYVEIA